MPSEKPFDLGKWRVEPARGVIVAGANEKRLEPKLMELLLLFAASGGRVLSKDEIVASVWGGRAVGDDTIAAAVSRLRSALEESDAQRFIETLPKRGYRFLVDIARTAPPAATKTSRAEDLVRQGEAQLRSPFPASHAQARLFFEAAIAEAPGFAPAHAGLADTLLAQRALAPARAAAHAAIGLDEHFARAWSTLGIVTLLLERDFEAADKSLARAIGLDAKLASAHRHRAFAFATVGRFVDAEREARTAVELEPVSLASRNLLMQLLIAARRYKWALAAANETVQMAPQSGEGWHAKAWAHLLLGDERASLEAFLKGLESWGLRRERIDSIHDRYDSDGFAAACAEAASLFDEQDLMFRPRATDIAILRTAARQFDEAFAALERALADDEPLLLLLPWLPHFDALREDSRYSVLLARIRLVH